MNWKHWVYLINLILWAGFKILPMIRNKNIKYYNQDFKDKDFWLDVAIILTFPQLISMMFIVGFIMSPKELKDFIKKSIN